MIQSPCEARSFDSGPKRPGRAMRITTWNVNSLRTRIERVVSWLEKHQPDVLCLQETKVVDEDFPLDRFEALGYQAVFRGQKTYNGVAIISREPAEDVVSDLPGDDASAEARLLAATIGDLRIVDVYVPNGKDIASEKFPYKIGWLTRLERMLRDAHDLSEDRVVLLGDFNIAPADQDVYDPDRWRGKVHFHWKEHEILGRFFDAGFTDLLRHVEPTSEQFTWWDYRGGAFPRNRGLRIDLVLGTAGLLDQVASVTVDREERKGDKPSDHAPVTLELA